MRTQTNPQPCTFLSHFSFHYCNLSCLLYSSPYSDTCQELPETFFLNYKWLPQANFFFFHITNSLWSSSANTIKASLPTYPSLQPQHQWQEATMILQFIVLALLKQQRRHWFSKPKAHGKAQKASLPSSDQRKEMLQRRGLPPAWCLLPLKREDGSTTSQELAGCSLTGVGVIILTQDPSCCLSHLTEKWTITGKTWPFLFFLSFEYSIWVTCRMADNTEGNSGKNTAGPSWMSALI